jgi:hypothetical protein
VARVWDVDDGKQSETPIQHLDYEGLLEAACKRAERNMSREEWRAYMGGEPYRETCPGKPVPGEETD